MATAPDWIEHFDLKPLPQEGGMYGEIYRCGESIPADSLPERFNGDRCFSTSIYYLLQHPEFSALHRLNQDEVWHFYDGAPLNIHVIEPTGNYECRKLGRNYEKGESPQQIVCAGALFCAEVATEGSFTLSGCTVAPGFEFADFEAPARALLLEEHPQHAQLINRFTRG